MGTGDKATAARSSDPRSTSVNSSTLTRNRIHSRYSQRVDKYRRAIAVPSPSLLTRCRTEPQHCNYVVYTVQYSLLVGTHLWPTTLSHLQCSSLWRTQEFFRGGGSTNSVEDRGQNGDLGCGSPLVRGSGGICNLVQEIPFHIVKLS